MFSAYTPKPSHFRFFLFMMTYIVMVCGHQKIINQMGTQIIQGQINRMIPINFGKPVQMIHTAKTTLAEDQKYIVVHPATVYPAFNNFQQTNSLPLPSNYKSLVEELRTYQTSHYKDMVIFDDYVFLHMIPNKIVVVKINASVLGMPDFMQRNILRNNVENIYKLDGLTSRNQTKMYKIKNGKQVSALLTTGSQTIYIIGIKQSTTITLNQAISISHIQFIADNIFIAAERGLGLSIYKIQSDRITKLKRYECDELVKKSNITSKSQIKINPSLPPRSLCFIPDVSFNQTSKKIYFLDSITGLYQSDLTISNYTIGNIELISSIPNCQAIDLVSSVHIVLVCQIGMPNSYIQQIIKLPDPFKSNSMVYIKKQPIFHQCSFNDLIVTQDFFLVFDQSNIEIFWNSQRSANNQFSTEHTKQQFNFPGLQIFALKRTNNLKQLLLYVVQSNVLMILKLNIFEGRVYVYSPIPIKKQIKVQVPGMCNQSIYPALTQNREFDRNYQCLYEKTVLIDIRQHFEPVTRQKVSMSIGVIILMLSVLLILIWICLVKYRGLQRHATKILQKYRQKRRYNDNKFTL